MEAIVTGEIRIPSSQVSKEMKDAYTYSYPLFGREYNKTIRNYRKVGNYVYFPRNLIKFRKYCNLKFKYNIAEGHKIDFKMVFPPLPYQEKPINAIVSKFSSNLNVMLEAQTRFGKSFSIVQVISLLKTNAIIIVDKKLLVSQFISDTNEYSKANIQEINKKNVASYDKSADIYITTFQFLNANPNLLDDIKQDFGMVVVDECHSVVASTYRSVLYSFNSRYRLGVSATPTAKANNLTGLITDTFEPVKVVGKYNGINVSYYKHRLPYHYQLDLSKPLSPQYSEYFLREDVTESVKSLILSLPEFRIMLAIPNQTVQNHYASVCRGIGRSVGIMNSEPHNLKLKEETLRNFKEGKLDTIVGLNQLMKGISAPIEIIIDFFAVGNVEATEQLVGRARTNFDGRKCSKYIQLQSKYKTNKNVKVENYLKNLDFVREE